jgi:hypothetical protein
MLDFLVVEFTKDKSVSVIYKGWFEPASGKEKDGTVYWPPTRDATSAAKKKQTPTDTWEQYPARIIYQCGMNIFSL